MVYNRLNTHAKSKNSFNKSAKKYNGYTGFNRWNSIWDHHRQFWCIAVHGNVSSPRLGKYCIANTIQSKMTSFLPAPFAISIAQIKEEQPCSGETVKHQLLLEGGFGLLLWSFGIGLILSERRIGKEQAAYQCQREK